MKAIFRLIETLIVAAFFAAAFAVPVWIVYACIETVVRLHIWPF